MATLRPRSFSVGLHVSALLVAVGLSSCKGGPAPEANGTPKLKAFLGRSDQLSRVQRLTIQRLDLPSSSKDEVTGTVTTQWEPGHLSLLPVTVEDVHKSGSELRGANVSLDEHYFKITSKYTSPTEGHHDHGEAVLDDNELRDLSEAIKFMQTEAGKWRTQRPSVATTLIFQSADGLKLVLGQASDDEPSYELSISAASEALSPSQLQALGNDIDAALEALKQH